MNGAVASGTDEYRQRFKARAAARIGVPLATFETVDSSQPRCAKYPLQSDPSLTPQQLRQLERRRRAQAVIGPWVGLIPDAQVGETR